MSKNKIYIDGPYIPNGTKLPENQSKFLSPNSDYLKVNVSELISKGITKLSEVFNYPGAITEAIDPMKLYMIIPELLKDYDINENISTTENLSLGNCTKRITIQAGGAIKDSSYRLVFPACSDSNFTQTQISVSERDTITSLQKEREDLNNSKKFFEYLKSGDIEKIFEHIHHCYEKKIEGMTAEEIEEEADLEYPFLREYEITMDKIRNDREDFLANFDDYIEDSWLMFFNMGCGDFCWWVSDFIESTSTYQTEREYKIKRRTSQVRSDSVLFLKLNELESDQLKNYLLDRIDSAIEDLDEQIQEVDDCIQRKWGAINGTNTEEEISILGVDDIIKLANLVARKTQFISYSDLTEITTDKLCKLDDFSYFVDRDCNIIILTPKGIFKYTTDEPNIAPEFITITSSLKNDVKVILDRLDRANEKALLKRLQEDKILTNHEGTSNHMEDGYKSIIEDLNLAKSMYEYVSSIKEENKEKYSKLCWKMQSLFPERKNTYGVISQTLTE